ncbi:RES family NAD+ phosphorylase [Segetibacter koreensis]|uniref:RES family NAD+ phosphorylase n=1 Tax=Segetibacter koreensis TaxID=398037 RepID=UPI00036FE2EF|nr:RES family NAD+ phosphorylase [Segetibacter koreensis]
MVVFRITHKNYSNQLFASGLKGRWNGAGNKVIYCAESIPLAFLENMIRRQGVGFNHDFKIMVIEIPDDLPVTSISVNDLKEGWRDFKDYSLCQPLGDKWYAECKTSLLKVPSAVLPECYNYVINTEHTDFKKIKLVETTDLIPDKRIEDILKRYRDRQ